MDRAEILELLHALAARLAGQLGLTSAAAVLEVASDVYGDRLDPAARFFVEELFS